MIDPIILTGNHVRLEPLSIDHKDALKQIANETQIWTYTLTSAYGDRFDAWFEKALIKSTSGEQRPFVVRNLSDNQLVGATRYYEINLKHLRLSIGHTWYHPRVWGTKVNIESKYLLLQHAFECLKINRVQFNVDARNARSLAALNKLGAVKEGILRQHMILEDERLRDTVVLSIISPEWMMVKKRIAAHLSM